MTPATRAGPIWLYAFVAFQVAAQAALLLPLGSGRTALRGLTFGSSLAMLALVPPGGRPPPHRDLAVAVLGCLTLGFLHPQLNSLVSGAASVALNLSIWAPVFWVGRVRIDARVLRRSLMILFAFHVISSVAGVLQVYDPDRFAPDSRFIEELLGPTADGLKVTLDDGRQVYRPFGLTDSPGGAAGSGAFAATVGLMLAASGTSPWRLKVIGIGAAGVGMFCLYVCQMRSALIVTCLGFGMMVALAMARGRATQATSLATAILIAVVGGFAWATAVGGNAVISRLETLVETDAATTYHKNRGTFLESTIEEIPTYVAGAGLGRWGMMNTYFGDKNNPDSPALWAEIQATAWLYDGGLPMLLLGYTAVCAACVHSCRIAVRSPDDGLADIAAVVAATNVSALAATMGYAMFISQGGMMFWVLNGALCAASTIRTLSPHSTPA